MSRAGAGPWIERILILLAIASLWPWILGWKHPFWRWSMWLMLAVMAALLVFNIIRLRRMAKDKSGDAD